MVQQEVTYAIIYGVSPVAEHVRRSFPASLHAIDIRINPAAPGTKLGGREVYHVDLIHLDEILSILLRHKVSKAIFCGHPTFRGSYFNFGRHYIARHWLNGIIMTAAKFFDTIDFTLRCHGISTVSFLCLDETLRLQPGFNGRVTSDLDLEAIGARYFEILPSSGPFRAVQAALATNSGVLRWEGIRGTDAMIKRFRRTAATTAKTVMFFKFPLKNCNPAFDLPTIGATTIRNLIDKGIAGVICDPSVTVCMDRDEVLELCETHDIFLYGVKQRLTPPSEQGQCLLPALCVP